MGEMGRIERGKLKMGVDEDNGVDGRDGEN
jgi:hypothetical protein